MRKSPRRALAAIAILTALGCAGGDDGSGPTGSISLSVSPSFLTLPQGGSGTVTVTLVRGGGFADPVNVAVTGLPAGVTSSVTPTQLTGAATQATVTVNVANTVAPGTYNVTITAATTGAGSPTTTLAVTVTAPTGGANFELDFCTADGVPLRVWRLSGTTWAEVAPTVVGNITRFSINISSTSGGVAYTIQASAFSKQNATRVSAPRSKLRAATEKMRSVRLRTANQVLPLDPNYFETQVLFGLASELAGYRETCVASPTLVSKTFNVTGIGASETGQLGYGESGTGLFSGTSSYNLMVPPGNYDWMAVFGNTPGPFPDVTYNWTAYRRGSNEAAPGAAVNVNRTGAPTFTTFPFTVSGGAGGSRWGYSQGLRGSRGFILGFLIGSLIGTSNTGNMLFPQVADRVSTDLWSLDVENILESGSTFDLRSFSSYVGSGPPASGNFTLPPAVPAFTVSPVMGAPLPWSVTGQTPAEYQTAVSLIGTTLDGGDGNAQLSMTATRGWQTANGMTTSYTLTGPNLPGFLPAWAPVGPIDHPSVAMGFGFFNAAPTAGSVAVIAGRVQ